MLLHECQKVAGPWRWKVDQFQIWHDENEATYKWIGYIEPQFDLTSFDIQIFKNASLFDIPAADPLDQDFVWKQIFKWLECFAPCSSNTKCERRKALKSRQRKKNIELESQTPHQLQYFMEFSIFEICGPQAIGS